MSPRRSDQRSVGPVHEPAHRAAAGLGAADLGDGIAHRARHRRDVGQPAVEEHLEPGVGRQRVAAPRSTPAISQAGASKGTDYG